MRYLTSAGEFFVAGRLRPEVERLWRRFYPAYTDRAFAERIQGLVRLDMDVLEVGAGSGEGLQNRFPLKGRCRRLVGIDLDPRVTSNTSLDEAHVADVCELPFGDEQFDLIYHTMVAEHIEHPERALREMARVLKPGGEIHFLTPSRFYYPMLLAQLTPTSVHRLIVGRLGSGRSEAEVFATFYRVNSAAAVRRLAQLAGLQAEVHHISTPPGYLRFNRLAFLCGVAYERLIERFLPALRAQLYIRLTKP